MGEKILATIEKSSRIDVKNLAALLRESEAAMANEIAEMERERTIRDYHTLIDWDNTSDEKIMALVEVKVTPQEGIGSDKIAKRICQYGEVEAVYLMLGAYDFTMFIEGKTMKQVALFVSNKLSPVGPVPGMATHLVSKKYGDHGIILADTVQDKRALIAP